MKQKIIWQLDPAADCFGRSAPRWRYVSPQGFDLRAYDDGTWCVFKPTQYTPSAAHGHAPSLEDAKRDAEQAYKAMRKP